MTDRAAPHHDWLNDGLYGVEDINYISFYTRSSPPSPPTDTGLCFAKADGRLYYKNAAGTEYDLTGGYAGGGSNMLTVSEDDGSSSLTADEALFPADWVTNPTGNVASIRPPYPDTPPRTSNADDDEFPGTSLDMCVWSWINQGSATEDVSHSLLQLAKASETSGDHLRLLVKTAPSAPYTITAKCFRNGAKATICWQFDIQQARTKLGRLYPQLP